MAKKKKWQLLMEKADLVSKEGKGSLWERIKILSQVSEDQQFKDDTIAAGNKPGVILNEKVNDTFATFSELFVMFKEFPNREQWADGDLPRMRSELRKILTARQSPDGTAAANGEHQEVKIKANGDRRLSWKQKYLELEARYNSLLVENRSLKDRVKSLERILKGRVAETDAA